jgi:hypothetical protein
MSLSINPFDTGGFRMKLVNWKISLGIAVLVSCLGVVPASADTILGPVSATTNMGELFPLVHAFDQSGLSNNYVSGVTNFDTFVATATHTSNPGADWVSAAMSGSAVFDLGSISTIDRAAVWNFGTGTGIPSFAIRDITLEGSLNDVTFFTLGTYTLTNPNGAPATLAQILSFSSVNLRYIRMDVIDTYGSNAALGEIAFSRAVAAVPEPSSLVLLGIGLAGLSLKLRRK